MCLYNVVVLSVVGLTLNLILDDQPALLYGITSGVLIIGTTATQLVVFVPKVGICLSVPYHFILNMTLNLILDDQPALLYGITSGVFIIGTTATQLVVFVPKVGICLSVWYYSILNMTLNHIFDDQPVLFYGIISRVLILAHNNTASCLCPKGMSYSKIYVKLPL